MFGAIIGDIIGSRFEFDNCKSKEFELFTNICDYTDDTVMTLAVAKTLLLYETITDMDGRLQAGACPGDARGRDAAPVLRLWRKILHMDDEE